MFRPAALVFLACLAAAPASAQVGAAACQPHRHDEVRCAIRLGIPGGSRVYEVMIHAARAGGEGRIQTDTYVSTCGLPGQMLGRSSIANAGASRVAQFANDRSHADAMSRAGVCVEVFLVNCTMGGRATSCQQVLNISGSRVEIR